MQYTRWHRYWFRCTISLVDDSFIANVNAWWFIEFIVLNVLPFRYFTPVQFNKHIFTEACGTLNKCHVVKTCSTHQLSMTWMLFLLFSWSNGFFKWQQKYMWKFHHMSYFIWVGLKQQIDDGLSLFSLIWTWKWFHGSEQKVSLKNVH